METEKARFTILFLDQGIILLCKNCQAYGQYRKHMFGSWGDVYKVRPLYYKGYKGKKIPW